MKFLSGLRWPPPIPGVDMSIDLRTVARTRKADGLERSGRGGTQDQTSTGVPR